jgi:guanyl-specific ribonuclease Sa
LDFQKIPMLQPTATGKPEFSAAHASTHTAHASTHTAHTSTHATHAATHTTHATAAHASTHAAAHAKVSTKTTRSATTARVDDLPQECTRVNVGSIAETPLGN